MPHSVSFSESEWGEKHTFSFQPVYAYHWLMVLMTQGGCMSQRARNKYNLTAIWKLAGEREMFLWLWTCTQDLSPSITCTHNLERSSELKIMARCCSLLWEEQQPNINCTPESEKQRGGGSSDQIQSYFLVDFGVMLGHSVNSYSRFVLQIKIKINYQCGEFE